MHILIFILGTMAAASDQWLCTEAASQRYGNVISSCGIGVGNDENSARLAAFDNAKIEFQRICENSDDCRDHQINIEPKRTACQDKGGHYKCYRMVEFSIKDEKPITPIAALKASLPQTTKASEQKIAKIKPGMMKAEILSNLGPPENVDQEVRMPHASFWGVKGVIFQYSGSLCSSSSYTVPMCNLSCNSHWETIEPSKCIVAFDGDKAVYIYNFKPMFIDY